MQKIIHNENKSFIINIVTVVLSSLLSLLAIWSNYLQVVPVASFLPFDSMLFLTFTSIIIFVLFFKKYSSGLIIYLTVISIFTILTPIFLKMIENKFVGRVSITSYLFGLFYVEPKVSAFQYVTQEDVGKQFWLFDPCVTINIVVLVYSIIDLIRSYKKMKSKNQRQVKIVGNISTIEENTLTRNNFKKNKSSKLFQNCYEIGVFLVFSILLFVSNLYFPNKELSSILFLTNLIVFSFLIIFGFILFKKDSFNLIIFTLFILLIMVYSRRWFYAIEHRFYYQVKRTTFFIGLVKFAPVDLLMGIRWFFDFSFIVSLGLFMYKLIVSLLDTKKVKHVTR